MTYATELIQQYRIALQYLWNVHFWTDKHFQSGESTGEFDKLKLPLFIGLVGIRLSPDFEGAPEIFGNSFKVVPRMSSGFELPLSSLYVGASMADFPPLTRWSIISGSFKATDIKLSLVDFFDWQAEYWRDFRYCLVKINDFPEQAHLVGRQALVEVSDVDVLWSSEPSPVYQEEFKVLI